MSALTHGSSTLATEVTHISSHSIWLLSHDKELFLPYAEFPWFKDQPVKATFMLKNNRPVISIGWILTWILRSNPSIPGKISVEVKNPESDRYAREVIDFLVQHRG